ncbi:hypothetical protein ASZ78_014885 [Callipepla squamata]|uniref:Uncharacterized protein n=1 Tax=Callipepla squamata TaxID=9009 RepID=A0A226ND54_CALSU|nr:hypothetical protein ASZ78_014885 [Callipepla squamata]
MLETEEKHPVFSALVQLAALLPPALRRGRTVCSVDDSFLTFPRPEQQVDVGDFVKMCLEANIPLEKADHPSVRAFLSRYVKNGSSIPKSEQLRKAYLPDGYDNENQLINTEDR